MTQKVGTHGKILREEIVEEFWVSSLQPTEKDVFVERRRLKT